MVVTERRLTAEAYLALPPEPNTQLVDGEVVVNDPSVRHQRILVELEALEGGRGEQLATPLLPGLAVDLGALFDR